MYQQFIQAFSPFFYGFFGMINQIIKIFFDIRIFDVSIIMFVIVPAFIGMIFYIIWQGRD
jgi:hypothetical protein